MEICEKEGDQYYHAATSRCPSEINPAELDPITIPEHIWPSFPTHLTRAPEPLSPDCLVKRPSLLDCDNIKASTEVGRTLLADAHIYKTLRTSNIAKYLGCKIKSGKIKGPCLVKYDRDLRQR
ncbi:hypothetical protein MMC14_009815, partial [Varicellaria rhodocarpa]|nr:hypothetical protein [Varicellaria rhodocarpa]